MRGCKRRVECGGSVGQYNARKDTQKCEQLKAGVTPSLECISSYYTKQTVLGQPLHTPHLNLKAADPCPC